MGGGDGRPNGRFFRLTWESIRSSFGPARFPLELVGTECPRTGESAKGCSFETSASHWLDGLSGSSCIRGMRTLETRPLGVQCSGVGR